LPKKSCCFGHFHIKVNNKQQRLLNLEI